MIFPSQRQSELYGEVGREIARYGEGAARREALDPATRPLPAYDCPTGTCATDKVCEEVKDGDTIAPDSREHVERNACNRCPGTNPDPVMHTVERLFGLTEREELSHYEDAEGNHWQHDNWLTAPRYHGDAGIGARDAQNMTFRVVLAAGGGRGWQCRYYGGALDDTSLDLGTFDYADGGTSMHMSMDVTPHNGNPNYAPNMTETF